VNSDVGSGNVVKIQLSAYWEVIFIYRQIYWYSIVKKYIIYHSSVFQGHTVHTWENYLTGERTV